MPPTYGKAECSICYIRLPKPEMVQHYSFQYEPGRTRTYFRNSSGGGSRETGRSVGEGRWRTQRRKASGVQPILPAIEAIAAHCEACSPSCSKTVIQEGGG